MTLEEATAQYYEDFDGIESQLECWDRQFESGLLIHAAIGILNQHETNCLARVSGLKSSMTWPSVREHYIQFLMAS